MAVDKAKLRLECDKLAREICYRRSSCEAAGKDRVACKGSLQWAHIVTRRNKRLRWSEENCCLLCAAHHLYYTYRPEEWMLFIAAEFPDRWDFVRTHHYEIWRENITNLQEIKNQLQTRLTELR